MRAKTVDLKTDKPTKLLLTFDEGCEIINVSRAKMYDLARRGEIKLIKIGRATRLRPADLEELVNRLAAR